MPACRFSLSRIALAALLAIASMAAVRGAAPEDATADLRAAIGNRSYADARRLLETLALPIERSVLQEINGAGEDYFHSEKYAVALPWYLLAAEKGYAPSQSNAGYVYLNGRAGIVDDAAAFAWFQKAAEQGDRSGQANLGYMYEYGRNVPPSATLARQYYELAARGDQPPEIPEVRFARERLTQLDNERKWPLHTAAKYGDLKTIREARNLNARDNENRTALMLAADADRVDSIGLLLQRGAATGMRDGEGKTALHYAIHLTRTGALKALIGHIELNFRDKTGATALFQACDFDASAAAILLLDHGAKPDVPDEQGNLPLLKAIEAGDPLLVEKLLSAGANPNPSGQDAETPLVKAATEEQVEIVALLLKRGAAVNHADAEGKTALMEAVDTGNLKIVQQLLQAGADVNRREKDGETALMMALDSEKEEIIDLLLANRAKTNVYDREGATPLSTAVAAENDRLAAKLLRAGADPNLIGHGATPAIFAALGKGNTELVKLLVQYGADFRRRDSDGDTSLHALFAGFQDGDGMELLRTMIAAGVDVNATTKDGVTPLMAACDSQFSDEAVPLLLEHGAKAGAIAKDGTTAIMACAFKGGIGAVRTILSRGADVNATTENGVTALMMALAAQKLDIVEFLLAHGTEARFRDSLGRSILLPALLQDKGAFLAELRRRTRNSQPFAEGLEKEVVAIEAVKRTAGDDPYRLARLLSSAVDLDSFGVTEVTPLMTAAGKGDVEQVRKLAAAGGNLTLQDSTQRTALHYAAGTKDGAAAEAMARVLREAGADGEAVDRDGRTALDTACEAGNWAAAKFLASRGQTLPPRCRLTIAAAEGVIEVLQSGMEAGLSLSDGYGELGTTPLLAALAARQTNAFRWLLAHGADTNRSDQTRATPMASAAEAGDLETVKLLDAMHVNLNVPRRALGSRSSGTPLHVALKNRKYEVASYLLVHGADPNVPDERGDTPLLEASQQQDATELVQQLIQQHADPNVRDRSGESPLFKALRSGSVANARMLIQHGADMDQGDFSGTTVLTLASFLGGKAFVELLLSSGANVNRDNLSGQSPLVAACQSGSAEIVRLLLAQKASLLQVFRDDDQDSTPLMIAASQGLRDIVSQLLRAGAQRSYRNESGKTAKDLAQQSGHPEIVQMLGMATPKPSERHHLRQ